MESASRIRRRWTEEENQILNQEAESQCGLPETHGLSVLTDTGVSEPWSPQRLEPDRSKTAWKDQQTGRTNKDCRKRWSKIGEVIKKGPWDGTEDERLRSAVGVYGPNWTQVALVVHTRNADQCAKRWQHSLDPSLDHSEWKAQSDQRLLAAVIAFGINWRTIRDRDFPGRSITDIKNRHSTLLRRRRTSSRLSVNDRSSPKLPAATKDEDQSFTPDSDHDDGDSSSLSSTVFSFQDTSQSTALDVRKGYEGATTYSEFDQAMMLETLKPFDLGLQQDHSALNMDMTMTGNGDAALQGEFFPSNPGVPCDGFAVDHQWDEDFVGMSSINAASTSIGASIPGRTGNEETGSRTMFTLYNVEQGTLNNILATAYKSKTKIKMETYH